MHGVIRIIYNGDKPTDVIVYPHKNEYKQCLKILERFQYDEENGAYTDRFDHDYDVNLELLEDLLKLIIRYHYFLTVDEPEDSLGKTLLHMIAIKLVPPFYLVYDKDDKRWKIAVKINNQLKTYEPEIIMDMVQLLKQ